MCDVAVTPRLIELLQARIQRRHRYTTNRVTPDPPVSVRSGHISSGLLTSVWNAVENWLFEGTGNERVYKSRMRQLYDHFGLTTDSIPYSDRTAGAFGLIGRHQSHEDCVAVLADSITPKPRRYRGRTSNE